MRAARGRPSGFRVTHFGAVMRPAPARHRLVGQFRRDDRTLGRLGDGAQRVVAPAGTDHFAVLVQLVLQERPVLVANGNPHRLGATLGHEDQCDALAGQCPCGHQRIVERVVDFTVREDHQYPVGAIASRCQQLGPLLQDRTQVRPTFGSDIGIEGIEVHLHRAAIHGERRQDVALAGEGDEAEPVARKVLDQAPGLAHGALQPARRHVLGKHRAAHVHGHDEVERPALRDHTAGPPRGRRRRSR